MKHKPTRPVAKLLQVARDHSYRTTMYARIKAIDELAARRDPSAIEPLRALLHDPLPDVCAHAMSALGTLRAAEAVPDLIALVQSEAENHHCAIASLGEIGNAPALDFLVAHIESRDMNAAAAASALSRHRDPRGVKAVTHIMLDPNDKWLGGTAGRLLAEFGPLALPPLLAAATNPNSEIRRRAYSGLSDIAFTRGAIPEGVRAAEALRSSLMAESDPQLADDLKIWIEILPRPH